MRDDGYAQALGLPRSYQRALARAKNSGFFLAGAFRREDDVYIVDTELHDTKRGRVVAQHSYRNGDPLALADEISIQIRSDLEIPAEHLENNPDLPVAEIESSSLAAIARATTGMTAFYLARDPQLATDSLEEAVQLDPTYASAHLLRFAAWSSADHPNRDTAKATQALQSTLQHLYRFSERQRLSVQSTASLLQRDFETCLSVNRTRTQLYPEDAQAHQTLARVLRLQGRDAEALASFQVAFEIEPDRWQLLLDIGDLLARTGDPGSALASYKLFEKEQPRSAEGPDRMGRVLISLGRLREAESSFAKAAVLEPGNVERTLAQGLVDERTGAWNEAERTYSGVLEGSASLSDSLAAHNSLKQLYRATGRLGLALQHAEQERSGHAKQRNSMKATAVDYEIASLYAVSGRGEDAQRLLARLAITCADEYRAMCALGAAQVQIELGEIEEAAGGLNRLESTLPTDKTSLLDHRVEELTARVLIARAEWASAVELLEQIRESTPAYEFAPENVESLARCHRELGDNAAARAELESLLSLRPARANTHLELALTLESLGELAGAELHLRAALSAWESAADAYPPLAEARELERRLSSE
jgi:tetratricopeptide (TPR) repeat protein